MKKPLLLIPVLFLALITNAKVVNITPTSPYYTHSNLQLALNAARTEKIDTILLAEGTYVESNNYLIADTNIVIMASETATTVPVVQIVTTFSIINNANVKIKGLKFDGSAQNSYDHFIRFKDKSHSSLVLEGCEFYDVKQIVIQGPDTTHTDSLVVNNCFFYNNRKQAIYFAASKTEGVQTCDSLAVTNSTFANTTALTNWISVIDIRPYNSALTDDIKAVVNHCTFYNNPTVDSGHANVRLYKINNAVVSNCVFAHPEPYDRCATYCSKGTISNCVSFNYIHDSNKGHAWGPTVTDCTLGNPVFKDPANNDFTLHNASAARRENGNVYGDPRWVKAITPVAIPATLLPVNAILSDSASVIYGTPDSINYKYVGSKKYNELEWAKWKVTVAKDGLYNFTAHTYRTSSQKYEIALLNSDESATIILNDNGKSSIGSGNASISTGNVSLESGKIYTIRVRNIYANADGVLLNVVASYEGGVSVAVPDTLWPIDALRSGRAFVNEDGELRFTDDDHAGYIHDQWGKWNISVAEDGKYKFTANVNSDNSQNYRITLKNGTESSTIGTWYGDKNSSGARKIATEMVNLTTGNYVLMIEDTVNYSHGRVANIVASYEGGKTVSVPGQILAKEAVIGQKEGGHEPKMYHLMESGDLKYDDNGNNMEEFATWTLNVTEAGEMEVTLDVPHIQGKGHIFSLELYQGNTRIDSIGEIWEGDDKTLWDYGNITLPDHLTFSSTGTYTLKLFNNQQYSGGALHAITFTPYVAPEPPTVVTMTDTDLDNTAWIDELNKTVDVQMTRTIKGGMYNTICLPFTLNSTKCKAIFGNDVELYTLDAATLSGEVLDLQFKVADDIWKGTPIIIKTSSDVVNPTFEGVTIERETGDHTQKGIVDFKSTFVQTTISAGNDNLLLYSDNKLVFPTDTRTLKGFRAYFHIQVSSPQQVIKHARIVTGGQVATEIDLVGNDNINETLKTIENNQLIIIRDGIRYNVCGQRIE